MKIVTLISACVFALGTTHALAQSAGMQHGHGDMPGMQDNSCSRTSPAAGDTHAGCGHVASAKQETAHQASGVVKKMDAAKGTVTISHGAVKDLKWPAMTMTFRVKDKSLLEQLKVDKKVDFTFVQQGNDYVIVAAR